MLLAMDHLPVLLLCCFLITVLSTPVTEKQDERPSYHQVLFGRVKRQTTTEEEEPVDPDCDFGDRDELALCQWRNMTGTIDNWNPTRGTRAGWIGGPTEDKTGQGSSQGGYAIYNTQKLIDNKYSQTLGFDAAMLVSPILSGTEAVGNCIDFWYAMSGLSQERLRILLRLQTPEMEQMNFHNMTNEQKRMKFMNSNGRDDIVLWENKDSTNDDWVNGQVVYSYDKEHVVIMEGLPVSISDPTRAYVGFIALDEIKFIDATECKPFCNFEGGLCSWTQDTNDDFDWSLSRGSLNPSTGPPMDRFSFSYGIVGGGGGYAYIDSGYPRRPLDKARLSSEVFSSPGPDAPLCMRFWAHMYGNGVGALRVLIAPTQGEEEIIWELKGEQGNNWYQGQVTITADSDFQIIFEAEVGDNGLGDIAIDEIALKENACPTSPQTASKFMNDCTFEDDMCGWKNIEFRQRMDELDWERALASQARAPNTDHTFKTSLGSYMTLPRSSVQRGERGWLMSSSIVPDGKPLCLSFWYFMYDPFIEQTGPALGSLKVMIMKTDQQGLQTIFPIWELRNHQGPDWKFGQARLESDQQFVVLFEGLWGNTRGSEYIAIDDVTFFNAECSTLPEKATASQMDCDFTRSSCSYMNTTGNGGERWYRATISRRPSTLADHTYGGPVGYIYYDVFNTNNNEVPRVSLMSSVITPRSGTDPVCLTFWYAPIGSDQESKLIITVESADESNNNSGGNDEVPVELWKLSANDVYKDRIEWMFGQVQITRSSDFKIAFVGEARKGGFALDDILVYPGGCNQRPEESDPSSSTTS